MKARPSERVVALARRLCADGAELHLFVLASDVWRDLDLSPPPRIHHPRRPEDRHPAYRLQRMLAFRLPGAVSALVRAATGGRSDRPAGRVVSAVTSGQQRFSELLYGRILHPAYRMVRPLLLAGMFRPEVRALDQCPINRIVACDLDAVTLAARLARRHPTAVATTSLDL
jgi:hypothetical protein